MTNSDKKEKQALLRLADLLVEDVLDSSDDEILSEFEKENGDPNEYAERMRVAFRQNLIKANKQKLEDAKAAVAQNRKNSAHRTPIMSIEEARAQLKRLNSDGFATEKLTLAARKESELSDDDILDLMEDLDALNLLPKEDSKDGD